MASYEWRGFVNVVSTWERGRERNAVGTWEREREKTECGGHVEGGWSHQDSNPCPETGSLDQLGHLDFVVTFF